MSGIKTNPSIFDFDFSIEFLRPTLWSLIVDYNFLIVMFGPLVMIIIASKSFGHRSHVTSVLWSLIKKRVMWLLALMAPRPLLFATHPTVPLQTHGQYYFN